MWWKEEKNDGEVKKNEMKTDSTQIFVSSYIFETVSKRTFFPTFLAKLAIHNKNVTFSLRVCDSM